MNIPKQAQAVIIGGGIAGCSVAYHLAKCGYKEVLLLERRQLTCGTTWHAAGLLPRLQPTKNWTTLSQYGHDLCGELESDTGLSTGYRAVGSLLLALTDERLHEAKRLVSAAAAFGAPSEMLSLSAIRDKWPNLKTEDAKGGAWFAGDAYCDPVNLTMALAAAARACGAVIIEGVEVEEVLCKEGQVYGVRTAHGEVQTQTIVCAAGMWAGKIGEQVGVQLPLGACEHFYIVTSPIKDLPENLPVLRVPDEQAYYKGDAGKIVLGAFERQAKPWGFDGIPQDFCFDSLPDDYEHFEPILEKAIARFPPLAEAGVQTFFNGPESFTPDGRYLLGAVPQRKGFYVIAGFNSKGIQSAVGAGMALAKWIADDAPPMDLSDVDIRRMAAFHSGRHYLQARLVESPGLLYADHFPYLQMETARGVRRSPLHDALGVRGACFGELYGWERANWFLPTAQQQVGEKPVYQYSWGRQNWFAYQAAEHLAMRNAVGFLDLSSFGKILASGPDAEQVLQRIACGDIASARGRALYTPLLNAGGGIEADVTISEVAENTWMINTPAAAVRRDLDWLQRHLPSSARCTFVDVTASESTLAIVGPQSRDFLQPLVGCSLSAEDFPFAAVRQTNIGYAVVRIYRLSFTGELGYELHISTDMAAHVFEVLMQRAADFPIAMCGMHAFDSCRLEKGFRHYGHDISDEDHLLEAGLGFTVAMDKTESTFGAFIGRDAIVQRKQSGLERRMLQFLLTDSEKLLYHHEPIWRDEQIAGYITSGNYGHTLGAAVGLGYVRCKEAGESIESMLKSTYAIEVAGEKIAAQVSARPLYDANGDRMRKG